jgi:hypothetical protein
MNDSGYVVAFNILDSGYRQWWLPAMMLVVIPMGIVIIALTEGRRRIETGRPSKQDFVKRMRAITIALAGLALVCASVVFAGTFGDYLNCSHALASGKASYVEGTVDNFVPMPHNGHGDESFTVGGVIFSYSDFLVQAGFNTTTFKNGPIRQGLPVRIWYVGNEIVKLEIKK